MKPTIAHAALFALLVFPLTAAIAPAQDSASYKQGTITTSEGPHKSYDLKGAEALYHLKNCGGGSFQTGQAVDYRVDDFTIYIRREGGKDSKCTVGSVDSVGSASDTPPPATYQQGTILGYDIRRDTSVFGGGGGGNGTPGMPVHTQTRQAKVYQLKAANAIYKVDYCGAFQAGQFQVGQVVDFRVDGERLYIRHDGDKEFNCKLEGATAVENAKPDAPAASGTSTPH